jgi:hypothetical protein
MEINSRINIGKFTNILKWNNAFLNNQWVKEEIKRKTNVEANERGNIACHILSNEAKSALRVTFIVIYMYFRKKKRSQINNLRLHFKELIKKEHPLMPCIISHHNGIKVDLNKKRNHKKYSNI